MRLLHVHNQRRLQSRLQFIANWHEKAMPSSYPESLIRLTELFTNDIRGRLLHHHEEQAGFSSPE
jgi:hypothetical protein